MSAPLTQRLCRLSGHDPQRAEHYGVLRTYAVLGGALVLLPSLTAWGMFATLYIGANMGIAEVLPLTVAAFSMTFLFDYWICTSPILTDRPAARWKYIGVRALLTIGVTSVTVYGLMIQLNAPELRHTTRVSADRQAKTDSTKATANLTQAIDQRNDQIQKLKSDNADGDRQLQRLYNKWHATWLTPCPTDESQSHTCDGRDIRTGPGHWRTRTAYDDFKKQNNKATAANQASIDTLQTANAVDAKTKAGIQKDSTKTARKNTGLGPKTKVLGDIFLHSPLLWLLALVLAVWDLGIAIIKTVMPINGFDREARARFAEEEGLERARSESAAWTEAYATIAAAEAERFVRARLQHIADHEEPAPRADAGASTSGRPLLPKGGAAGIAAAVVIALIASVAFVAVHNAGAKKASSSSTTSKHVALTGAQTIRVSPQRAISVSVPGVGTLSASKGSFSRVGTITVSTGRSQPPASDGVTAAGQGVDVVFHGTSLTKPMTLGFPMTQKLSANEMPVLAHRADDGKWNYVPVTLHGNTAVVATKAFSFNVLGVVSDVGHFIGDHLAHWIAGRTSPIQCSGAPSWFHLEQKHSDLVHVCATDAGQKDGVDRAEVRIKSNRGVTVEVTIPGNPQYVWVEGQPWPLRQVTMGALNLDPNQTVLLPAGKTMTIGYTRTNPSQDLMADVSGATGYALLDTLIRQTLDYALGTIDETFVAYTLFKCATGLQPALVTSTPSLEDNGVGGVIKCMLESSFDEVSGSDKSALQFVQRLKGTISVDSLVKVAKGLKAAGLVATAYIPLLQDGAGNLWDEAKSWQSGGANDIVHYEIDGMSPANNGGSLSVGPGNGLQDQSGVPNLQGGDGSSLQGGSGSGGTPSATPTPVHTPTPQPHTPAPTPTPGGGGARDFYNTWSEPVQGHAMCRGNPSNSDSIPGGTVTSTSTVEAAGEVDSAKVQIDADQQTTSTATLVVNGQDEASDSESGGGDVTFAFAATAVKPGDRLGLRITFQASYGKIATIYSASNPSGNLSATNTCPAHAPSFSMDGQGIRAIISGSA